MSMRIASAEIVSVFYLLIIFASVGLRSERGSKSNRLFMAVTASAGAGLIFDAMSYITDEHSCSRIVMTVVNILAYSTINVCIVIFSFYMMQLIRRGVDVSNRPIYPVIAVSALDVLLIIIGAVNGRFFKVVDCEYVYGPWKDVLTIMPIFCLIAILVILLIYSKPLGKKNTLVLASFVAFPIDASIVLIFMPDYGLGYLAIALSCAVIFTFVRREEIIEAQNREQIIKEVVSLDALTGLLNRRGFNEAIEKADEHGCLGIAFCDLNALKYTNDHFGHVAGDKYIQKFADILKQVFKDQGLICRISGDEFTVLLFDISEDGFRELKEGLDRAIADNSRIASVGYAYGDASDAMKLFGQAEHEMYDDKNRYYTETGIDRRRRGT